MTAVAEIAFPDKTNIISNISLSRFTIARRIEDLSENIATTLHERIAKSEYCSLELDESWDISETAQLAIFLRDTDTKFNITEELCLLILMQGTTTGKDLYDEVKSVWKFHQGNLCAKRLSLPNVTVLIIKLINFIKSYALKHREFKEFLKDLETEYGDVIFNIEVFWFSRGAMLKRVHNLKIEIQLFLDMKGYAFPHFVNKEWMCNFGYLIDIT